MALGKKMPTELIWSTVYTPSTWKDDTHYSSFKAVGSDRIDLHVFPSSLFGPNQYAVINGFQLEFLSMTNFH